MPFRTQGHWPPATTCVACGHEDAHSTLFGCGRTERKRVGFLRWKKVRCDCREFVDPFSVADRPQGSCVSPPPPIRIIVEKG